MVLHDAFEKQDNQPKSTLEPHVIEAEKLALAAPLDRMASVIVDFTLMGLVVSFAVAPLTAKLEAVRAIDDADAFLAVSSQTLLLSAFVILLYQVCAVHLFGSTFGQRCMDLEVRNIWDSQRPSWLQALLRALLWWLDLALLFPMGAIFSDPLRRPSHDRHANTVVVNCKGRRTPAPVSSERQSAHVLTLLFLIAGSVTLAVTVERETSLFSRMLGGETLAPVEVAECEAVRNVTDTWPLENGKRASPLQIGLALYAAGQISETCLEEEAQVAFQKKQPEDLAFLARAFTTSGEAELSDAYHSEVCAQSANSEACHLAKVFSLLDEHQTAKASEIFKKYLPQSSLYFKLWAVIHFEKALDFNSELELIDTVWPRPEVAHFLSTRRAVALWGLHRLDEARVAMASVVTAPNDQKALQVASWFCSEELETTCPKETPQSCRVFRSGVDLEPLILEEAPHAVAYLKLEECSKASQTNYKVVRNLISNKDVLKLIDAIEAAHETAHQTSHQAVAAVAKQGFLDLIQNEDTDPSVVAEADRRLIDLVHSSRELGFLKERWQENDVRDWSWKTTGLRLLKKYSELEAWQEASELGAGLMKVDPNDRDLQNQLIYLSYKAQDYEKAWSYLKSQSSHRRLPASLNPELEAIKSALKNRFGSQ